MAVANPYAVSSGEELLAQRTGEDYTPYTPDEPVIDSYYPPVATVLPTSSPEIAIETDYRYVGPPTTIYVPPAEDPQLAPDPTVQFTPDPTKAPKDPATCGTCNLEGDGYSRGSTPAGTGTGDPYLSGFVTAPQGNAKPLSAATMAQDGDVALTISWKTVLIIIAALVFTKWAELW